MLRDKQSEHSFSFNLLKLLVFVIQNFILICIWEYTSSYLALALNTLRAALPARVSYRNVQSGITKQVMSGCNQLRSARSVVGLQNALSLSIHL